MTSRGAKIQGFTLTEIAIVLSIVGLVLGAIWAATADVSRNQKITTAAGQFMTIAQGIRGVMGANIVTGFADGANETYNFCEAGVFPSNVVPNAGCGTSANPAAISDPWGGQTYVYAESITAAGVGDGFAIKMTNLDQAGCVDLLAALGGQSRDSGLVYLNGGLVAPDYAVGAAQPLAFPITPVAAATVCGNGLNTVVAVFGLKG